MFISKRVLIIVGAVAVVVVGLTVFAFVFFLSQSNQSATSRATPPQSARLLLRRRCAPALWAVIHRSQFIICRR